jgi:hypothetical protein
MTTQLSTKLTALALALMVNGLMIGVVVYLFGGQNHDDGAAPALVQAASARAPSAV